MDKHPANDSSVHAANRSQLYLSFAMAFSYPGEDFITSLQNREFIEQLKRLGSDLPYSISFEGLLKPEVYESISKEEIQVFYSTMFQAGNQAVSLRELAYSTLTEKALIEEIFRFYQHAGLTFSQGELRELPDNLPIELEFLHYLSFLEAETAATNASSDNIAALRRLQCDFVNLHPGRWVHSFLNRLETQPDSSVYQALTNLLILFIQKEKQFLMGQSETLIAVSN
jgi:putative dimethyl sulfoxide reductase chaperone